MVSREHIINQAFIESKPAAQMAAEMRGGRNAAGLLRSGDVRGGFNPAILAPLLPALSSLAKEAVPDIYSGIKNITGKVGSWLKRLFGGARERPYGRHASWYNDRKQPMEDYENMGLYSGNQTMADYVGYMDLRQRKDHKIAMKVKGGFSEADVPKILEIYRTNPKFADKLNRSTKPHKFINRIVKELGKKKDM